MEMTDRDGWEKPLEGGDAGKPMEAASKRAEHGTSI
jgi:4-alpha-glucanotransferase